MEDSLKKYIRAAKSVLINNRSSAYTLPSSSLYPHQWNWDSGFIAIGYSHFDTEWAMKELESLFSAQWKNGMLPQIVFNKDKLGQYFPEPDFWQTELSPDAPEGFLTSGITMPPIHAVAVLKIYENSSNENKVAPFLQWIFPKLLSLHRYLYRERDYAGDGLIYIRHPWESGMDNSPTWDKVLKKIDLSHVKLPSYYRKDTKSGVSPEMRPTKEYYDYFVYLIELFKNEKYDEKEISKKCPFLVCGPLFNAILCASNEALMKISDILNEPYSEIEQWYNLTAESIRKRLYHKERGVFDAFDIRSGELLELETASGFMPIFGGAASREQADRIYQYLNSKSFCALHQGNCFTIPSFDTQKEGFKRENYWRGPVWININWMLSQGLRRYGFLQKADSLSRHILELPMRFGFSEYFDSFDGRGYGSKDFSWTASLFIDTAYEIYVKTRKGGFIDMTKSILIRDRLLNRTGEPFDVAGITISQEMLQAMKELKANYYTPEGTVDYESIKVSNEYRQYKGIIAALRKFDPSLLRDERQQLAFWINLYNTIVVDGIIETNVKESVKEVVGFFSKIKYIIGGNRFSPDDIEHGILRANKRKPSRPWRQFGIFNPKKRLSLKHLDPRVHFALVCGSRSCAPIKYYTPEGIYDELELATESFVNSSEVMIMPEENRVLISQIFKWYEPDFGGTSGAINFIQKYILDKDKKDFLERDIAHLGIDYLHYDWNLNK
jgi:hypothetical protein